MTGYEPRLRVSRFESGPSIDQALVLLLGAKEASTPLRWSCLEGVPEYLAGRGWVTIGSRYETEADAGTFDAYLKTCIKRVTANWVAVVLAQAGVVDLDNGRPGRVRLVGSFMAPQLGTIEAVEICECQLTSTSTRI